jgi:hypothetical protein
MVDTRPPNVKRPKKEPVLEGRLKTDALVAPVLSGFVPTTFSSLGVLNYRYQGGTTFDLLGLP